MIKGQYVFYKEELYIVEQDGDVLTERRWVLIRNIVTNCLVIAFRQDTRPLTIAEKLLYLKD